MRKTIISLITVTCLGFSMVSYAMPLLDREERIQMPGGRQQSVLVNNITGQVTQYKTQSGWDDSNTGYLRNLQRLHELQKKRSKKKTGYDFYRDH